MVSLSTRELFRKYAGGMAYVSVRQPNGEESIGTAFHVGDGVFVTARHVLDGNTILSVATVVNRYVPDPTGLVSIAGFPGYFRSVEARKGTHRDGPFFHPDRSVDVAAIVVDGLEPSIVPLGGHLDDWVNDDAFILSRGIIMGFPPIPLTNRPVLVTATAEVNAVVDKYSGRHPHFVMSAMPRGGFSGGVCILEWDFALGIITESLNRDHRPIEQGFMAVLTVEPIRACLEHHGLLPEAQRLKGA